MASTSERVVFWYGCNATRHGDIIHSAIELLRAVGVESDPAGGPAYCCGTAKDGNLAAAAGMASRTVDKFNQSGRDKVVTWCPSCHRHAGTFMQGVNPAKFEVSHITQMLHARRDVLAPLLTHPIERRVVLHAHSGFHEVDAYPLIADLLRLIPGLELIVTDYAAPGHMCSAVSAVPAALKDVVRTSVELCHEHDSDTLVTAFHACQRILCGLATTDGIKAVNYVNLLIEAMGLPVPADEYSEWKNAGSETALREKIGAERISRIGADFFTQQVMPELRKLPEK
jgi:Fe-S oxidoreductase